MFPPVTKREPVTLRLPDTNVLVPICNPLFGEITA